MTPKHQRASFLRSTTGRRRHDRHPPTRFCGGIGNSSRGSGRTRRGLNVPACSRRSAGWWCGWQRRTHLGLYPDPWCPQECGASRRAIDHRPHPQGTGHPTGAGAADGVADVFASALGRDRGCGFIYDRSLDLAGLRDVLHRVRDRPGPPSRAHGRIDAASRRAIHGSSWPHPHRRR
jgi:hypothetical protein